MLSKMASNNSGGGGNSGGTGSGRRLPLSLSGGTSVARLQQSSGSNGRSNSPQNANKKITESFLPVKKTTQPRTTSTSSSSSSTSSQNGISKSTNGKDKSQNGSSTGKDQKEHKSKDKVPEKMDTERKDVEVVAEIKEIKDKEVFTEKKDKEVFAEKEEKELSSDKKEAQEETKKKATTESTPASQPASDVVVIDDDVEVIPNLSTPTKDRKSTRNSGSQQKSPISKPSSASPAQKKQIEAVPSSVGSLTPQEDVEMEPLQVDASPIRSVHGNLNAVPAATSTPGRSLFSFRGSSKQTAEVQLAAQPSSSPVGTPARSFAAISGRRSIRPIDSLTPSKVGTYRCGNSDLDTSNCTNASMNATVGSDIPNSSSFSFSFLSRGRKRDRTPPPLSATQSTTDLGQDVEMSPPKRARFDFFSLNLGSPFSLLRSRFSKATISSPARVLELNGSGVEEQVPISSISVPEEIDVEEEQAAENVTVGQEAGLETPKKSGSPTKENSAKKDDQDKKVVGQEVDEKSSDGENIPPVVEDAEDAAPAENRSRCSVM